MIYDCFHKWTFSDLLIYAGGATGVPMSPANATIRNVRADLVGVARVPSVEAFRTVEQQFLRKEQCGYITKLTIVMVYPVAHTGLALHL